MTSFSRDELEEAQRLLDKERSRSASSSTLDLRALIRRRRPSADAPATVLMRRPGRLARMWRAFVWWLRY